MDNQTIIVKRIKKAGHGHHGGAWKVAFADFVTAMMAFFLLLWLLAATTKEEQAGLAEYFSPTTTGMADGDGVKISVVDLGGGQEISEGDNAQEDTAKSTEEALQREQERLESLMEELKKAIETSQALKPFKDQLLLDITPEGLRIQIVDKENRPMFDSGSAELKSYTKEILHELAKTINTVPNRISLTGHTDASRFISKRGYTNWELSADRANASRRELVVGGLAQEKVAKVVGLASIVPFNKEDPLSPINRRIALIVMNKAAEDALMHDGERVSSEQEASEVLEQSQNTVRPSVGSIAGALRKTRTAKTGANKQQAEPAKAESPVKQPQPVNEEVVSRKTQQKDSAPVELGPPAEDNGEAVIPIINPIQLPDIPGAD